MTHEIPKIEEIDKPAKRHYEKPVLVEQGPVGELTQSGNGHQAHDGVFTRALS